MTVSTQSLVATCAGIGLGWPILIIVIAASNIVTTHSQLLGNETDSSNATYEDHQRFTTRSPLQNAQNIYYGVPITFMLAGIIGALACMRITYKVGSTLNDSQFRCAAASGMSFAAALTLIIAVASGGFSEALLGNNNRPFAVVGSLVLGVFSAIIAILSGVRLWKRAHRGSFFTEGLHHNADNLLPPEAGLQP